MPRPPRLCGLILTLALLAVAGCTNPPPTPPAEEESSLPAPVTRILDKPQYEHASWGLLETDPDNSRTGLARRANEMFAPGSTAKLFSISGAWQALGPDSRIRTPVYQRGSRTGARLDGDLILVGAGDVTFGGRTRADGTVAYTAIDHVDANTIPGATLTPQNPLAGILSLAAQIRASGVRRVAGDVVVDDRLFSSTWDPEPTPIMINDNVIDILVRPAVAGRPATLSVRPLAASYTVASSVRTVAAGQASAITVSGSAPGRITVTGTIAADAEPLLQVAPITDVSAFARTTLIEALEAAGVQVDAAPTGANPVNLLPRSSQYPRQSRVAEFVSPVYAEQAKLILKVSLNLGANLAICQLAVRAGSSDCEDGFAPLRTFLTGAGVDVESMALSDGRGGDPADRATPLAVTQILRYWTRQADFDRWRTSLPILGVDGTLAANAKESPARGKVFAKTGTAAAGDPLNGTVQVQAKALAGYLERPDGSWLIFDVVVNNAGASPDLSALVAAGEDVAEVAAALWDEAQER
jgi:serine-type D-Ala-D-Ala carboxypeptidase/endopeptidase (penicillin-binding protein 4)